MDKIKAYGIDLGTTYSAIAYLDDAGQPKIIKNNSHGSDLLASAVYFQEGSDPVVGVIAKEEAELNPGRVVQFIKREIGKEGAIVREFNDKTFNAIEISGLILKQIVKYAGEQGHDVKKVVITCPAYFGTNEREATRQAGELAGLEVLNLINEPTAAAYNYLAKEFNESKKILVYDLGGGTFDVSYIDYTVEGERTIVDVVSSEGDDKLGGADWDERLFGYVKEEFLKLRSQDYDKDKFDGDLDLKQDVRIKVENTKQRLSDMAKVNLTIAGTRLTVERTKFEELTRDLVERTIHMVKNVMARCKITESDIDLVLLVGGSTMMPMIQDAVKGIFGAEKVRIEEPHEAVAKGAALAAAAEITEKIGEIVRAAQEGKTLNEEEKKAVQDLLGNDKLTVDAAAIGKLAEAAPIMSSGFLRKTTLIDRLSRSFGPDVARYANGSNPHPIYIDNLLFMGTKTPVEAVGEYAVPQDNISSLSVSLYESRVEKGNPPIELTAPDGSNLDLDPTLAVKSIGNLVLPLPPGTRAGTPVKVYVKAKSGGLDFHVINPATGEKQEAFVESEFTMSPAEMAESKEKMDGQNTTGG